MPQILKKKKKTKTNLLLVNATSGGLGAEPQATAATAGCYKNHNNYRTRFLNNFMLLQVVTSIVCVVIQILAGTKFEQKAHVSR